MNDQVDLNNGNIIKKKKSVFKIILLILKILFFYIYIPLLLLWCIVKILFHIVVSLVKLFYKLLKKIVIYIRNNPVKSCITTASILFIIAIVINIIDFKKNYNNIYLTNSKFISYSDSVMMLNSKLDRIDGKILTLDGIKNTDIKIYSGNLVIKEEKINKKKHWKVNLDYLSDGINIVDISVNFKNGKVKKKKFYIYNKFKDNANGLDKKDSDKDGIVNYKEEVFGTDKSKSDTDGDGITDYDEIYKTFTDPLLSASFNGVSDLLADNDNDSISNSDELKFNINPNRKDTDGDGISDYDEIYKYKTEPLKNDTDGDGISDGDEVNIGINPIEKTDKFTARHNSDDDVTNVSLNYISFKQYKSLKIIDSGNSFGLKKSSSYIAGPYNFHIDGKFDNAVISFKFDTSKLKEGSNPTIYYINEKTNNLEALNTTISNNIASTTVNHFSSYVLLDKHDIDMKVNNAPKVDGSNVDKESISTTEYIVVANPILNAFGFPMNIYIVDASDKMVEKTKLAIQNLLDENYSDLNLKIEYDSISKTKASIYDFLFASFEEDTVDRIVTDGNEEDRGIAQAILHVFFAYKHIYGGADLELYLTGEVNGRISDENAIDKKKDSNKDGISDYYTKLICNGQLTTYYGTNPFKKYTYTQIQRGGKDFDDDGLDNDQEIEIVKKDGSYYVVEHTSPVDYDSDEDGVNDRKDKSPNIAFDSDFKSVSNFSYIPKTLAQDKFEKESKKNYNTVSGDDCGKFSCGNVEFRAEMLLTITDSMHAAEALSHFLDNTGSILDFGLDWSLIEDTYSGKDNFVNNIEKIMEVAEDTIKEGDTLYFITDKQLLGTDFSNDFEDLADVSWWYAIGYTNANMKAKITNLDDKKYQMELWYYIDDYYDWNPDQTMFNGGFGGTVSDSEMYQLHLHGRAKQYRIQIPYKMKVTWNYGDRYYLSKTFTWERPSSMKIEKLN